MKDTYIFRRVEKKYPLSEARAQRFLQDVLPYTDPDPHGKSTVASVYLDTPTHLLIRNSLDARTYKEKLRIRSYGTPADTDKVFLEIKKKFKGVVYKRRVSLTAAQAERYVKTGEKPFESQIFSEIDHAMRLYEKPQPSMLIACERSAYFVKEAPHIRLTFDRNIRFRETALSLTLGSDGTPLLPPDAVILEVKTDGAMPLWLAHALDAHAIYPSSFSKYGTAYRTTYLEGGFPCVRFI